MDPEGQLPPHIAALIALGDVVTRYLHASLMSLLILLHII